MQEFFQTWIPIFRDFALIGLAVWAGYLSKFVVKAKEAENALLKAQLAKVQSESSASIAQKYEQVVRMAERISKENLDLQEKLGLSEAKVADVLKLVDENRRMGIARGLMEGIGLARELDAKQGLVKPTLAQILSGVTPLQEIVRHLSEQLQIALREEPPLRKAQAFAVWVLGGDAEMVAAAAKPGS